MSPPFTLHHFTPHHSTSRHHCTTFHITLLHTTCSTPYLGHLLLQHISPRTTIFYIWRHITPKSASHRHFQVHVPHHTATVHISHHPIYTTIPHHTHIHHSIFHTTPYSTSHFTTTSDITTHCIISTSDITQRIAYATFFTTTILHHHTSHRYFPLMQHSTYIALCNIPHNRTPHSTPRHIAHFAFQLHHVWNGNIHIGPHFTYADVTPHFTSNRSTAPHLGTHSTSCPHSTPCTSHSNINFTSHYPIAPHISPTLHFNHHSASHRPV